MITDAAVVAYAEAHSSKESEVLRHVAEVTRQSTDAPQMMVGPLEGRFLELLVWLTSPSLVVEIGTFTGYSALAMASALDPGACLVTCEVDPDRAALAQRHFDLSPAGERIDLRVGPAAETLASLEGPFDLVFIDADKAGYAGYYEAVVPKLSARGLVAVDNVLWDGAVVDPPADDEDARALAAFNDMVVADPRVVAVMLTIRDGVSLIRPA